MSEYFKTYSLWSYGNSFKNDGTVVSRPGQDRKRMTTASEDRYLALTARCNRKATASPVKPQSLQPPLSCCITANNIQKA
ncbi:hypothetical protein TNCV_1945871 [Trichonephila clavipes]|nr:hypothetical protein TNCV_1945871 [Trichonephila clavipes]